MGKNWKRIKSIDDLGEMINVVVRYYSDDDKRKLRRILKNAPEDESTFTVPAADLLTYWLFPEKDPTDPEMASFDAIRKQIKDALPDLKRHFETCGKDLRGQRKEERSSHISERFGVGGGLAIANELMGFTQADWEPIEKSRNEDNIEEPRFDFRFASDGSRYVSVENKGTFVEDNREKTGGVSKRMQSIRKKKRSLRKKTKTKASLIGTIMATDFRDDSVLRCWLVDPPIPPPSDVDPETFRILARLSHYRRLLRLVFPYWNSLHTALSDRQKEIGWRDNWEMHQWDFLTYVDSRRKIRIADTKQRKPTAFGGTTVGVIRAVDSQYYLYFGFQQRILSMLVEQDLATLRQYHEKPKVALATLEWFPTEHEKQTLLKRLDGAKVVNGQAIVSCKLHRNSAGWVFGLLPRKDYPSKAAQQPRVVKATADQFTKRLDR